MRLEAVRLRSPFMQDEIVKEREMSISALEARVPTGRNSPPSDSIHRAKHYLHAGQLFASSEPCAITTILGSCVAVCLWDPIAGIGGANHYLLPTSSDEKPSVFRTGRMAIPALIKEVVRLGADKSRLKAKVFGGANVIEAFQNKKIHLGTHNVQMALVILATENIPVVARDIGGKRGRKVIFHVDTGDVWIKAL